MFARESQIENQDAIDETIVGILPNPKEVNIFFFMPLYKYLVYMQAYAYFTKLHLFF